MGSNPTSHTMKQQEKQLLLESRKVLTDEISGLYFDEYNDYVDKLDELNRQIEKIDKLLINKS